AGSNPAPATKSHKNITQKPASRGLLHFCLPIGRGRHPGRGNRLMNHAFAPIGEARIAFGSTHLSVLKQRMTA
ncbi:hypothetical protein, partial [Rhizobium leguminosarum]|uniref:hypothetical protein n=1 Tax=Rhizobium leguminosarum TaxID=384 RepID=UPI001A8E2889